MFFGKKEKLVKIFLREQRLKVVKKISKGYSSEVFLVENLVGERLALKVEKPSSPRKNLVQKEVSNLLLANSKNIGPKLVDFNKECGVILMEFVDGPSFKEWLFEWGPSKKSLERFVGNLLLQARTLDRLQVDHGQLSGRGTNILVRRGLPVIIDFEKASQVRKCKNENQLKSFLFKNPHSAIAKKVRETLGLNTRF